MDGFIDNLEKVIKSIHGVDSLPIDVLYRVVFFLFTRAGLNLSDVTDTQRIEFEKLLEKIPAGFMWIVKGQPYLHALEFLNSLKSMLWESRRPVLVREASVRYILDFLEKKVKRVDGVIVLDCGSIPEMATMAIKLTHMNRNILFYSEVFVNPIGVTRFLTEQLKHLERRSMLEEYARLLKERLGAYSYKVIPSIDLTVHERGLSIEDFVNSLNIREIFEQVYQYVKGRSILITADHGYDLVVDEHGIYVTHGYKYKCLLNFSRIALFMVVD